MKKYLGLLMIFSLFFVASYAQAEGEWKPGTPKPKLGAPEASATMESNDDEKSLEGLAKQNKLRDEMHNKIEAMKAKADQVREEAQTKLEALREQIKNKKDSVKEGLRLDARQNAFMRFNKEMEKVTKLEARVTEQLNKVQAMGIDVTEATTFVNNAEAKFAEAKTLDAKIKTALTKSTNELTKAEKTQIMKDSKTMETNLQDAYKEFNKAVRSLREAVKAYQASTTNTGAPVSSTTNQ